MIAHIVEIEMEELTLDHIYQLPKKEKYKVFAYAQRRLRQIRREIRNKTERKDSG